VNNRFFPFMPVFFLISIMTLALLAGCSGNPGKEIVFKAEKLYHDAEKLKQKAAIKPEFNDEEIRSQLKSAYLQVTDYCWTHIDSLPADKYPKDLKSLESVAFMAANRLTQIYFSQKKYDSVVAVSRQLLNFAHLEGTQLLTTQLNLAFALQSGGDLQGAVDIYHAQIDAFYPPVDNNNQIITSVLNLPMDIVKIYRMISNDSLAQIETEAGERYYEKLIKDWPNSDLATAARSNLASLYYGAGDWDKAISNLEMLKDSTGQVNIEAALMIASIIMRGKQDYKEALRLYDQISQRTTDTTILPMIMLRKGIAYYDQKQYDRCRKIMGDINDEYPGYFKRNSLPQKYIAMSFMKLGEWMRAENEFKWLIDNYSTSEAAFDAHLVIAEHYQKAKDDEMARTWFRRAEEFYKTMAARHPGSNIEASALSYLAELERMREDWKFAAGYLETLYDKFPSTDVGRKALINAATVYRDELDNPAKADSLIERLKSELFPLDNSKNINVISDDIK